MSMKPPPDRCVHCLGHFRTLTWDHLLPISWYPDTTPPNLEKWKFPSCEPCNNEHSKIEESLLRRFALCLDPKDARSAGIPDKVLRSLKPEHAKTEKDRQVRRALREKVLKDEFMTLDAPPDHGVFPGFGPQPGVNYPQLIAIRIPQKELERLTTKLVRGITWKLDNRFIEADEEITISFLRDKDAMEVFGALLHKGAFFDIGPGIRIWRGVAPDDRRSALLAIQIWGRARLYAGVTPQGEADATNQSANSKKPL